MKLLVAVAILLGLPPINSGRAQFIKRDNLEVIIRCTVSGPETTYFYLVRNIPSSEQSLETLRLEVGDYDSADGGSLHGFVIPTNWTGYVDNIRAFPIDHDARALVIVGLADTISSIDELYSLPQHALYPGDSLAFSFKTNAIPSVKRFWARGWARPLTMFEYDSLRTLGQSHADIIKPWYEDAFVAKTISPILPPTPFNSLHFLDTLKSYIYESRSLGWITNDATANNYRRLIDTARFHLQANNRGVAKAKLDSVLVSVYPDSAAGLITSEAYALLRFNTEYLLKKLSEE